MFSHILECPKCNHRFGYDRENGLPEQIVCPGCGESSPSNDFCSMMICPECRTKLKVPLDILFEPDLACPQCGKPLQVTDGMQDAADSTAGSSPQERRSVFRRMLQDGELFDKFRILRLLGRGGMAEVYLAEHLLLNRKCALKLMRQGMGSDDPVFVKRFIREAKLSHSIDHPNIVKVFDVGSDFKTGYLFIAMEYVEGKTLLELSAEHKMSEAELLEIAGAMTSALAVLDSHHIVHRDIKPSNIMKTPDGVYKLMDLGIAKSSGGQDGEVTLTLEQATIGTPSYASPEQCRSAHNTDIRSDIYCLGATLYHLACGKLPFEGGTPVEIILKVMREEAEPLEKLRPDLSAHFVSLIARMMKKDPADRPQSPAELMLCFSGKTASGTDPKRRIFPEKLFRRFSLPYLLAGIGISASIVLIVLYLWKNGNGHPEETVSPAKTPAVKSPALPPEPRTAPPEPRTAPPEQQDRTEPVAVPPPTGEKNVPELQPWKVTPAVGTPVIAAWTDFEKNAKNFMISSNAVRENGGIRSVNSGSLCSFTVDNGGKDFRVEICADALNYPSAFFVSLMTPTSRTSAIVFSCVLPPGQKKYLFTVPVTRLLDSPSGRMRLGIYSTVGRIRINSVTVYESDGKTDGDYFESAAVWKKTREVAGCRSFRPEEGRFHLMGAAVKDGALYLDSPRSSAAFPYNIRKDSLIRLRAKSTGGPAVISLRGTGQFNPIFSAVLSEEEKEYLIPFPASSFSPPIRLSLQSGSGQARISSPTFLEREE